MIFIGFFLDKLRTKTFRRIHFLLTKQEENKWAINHILSRKRIIMVDKKLLNFFGVFIHFLE